MSSIRHIGVWIAAVLLVAVRGIAAECPYLYGIHDHEPAPTEYLNHVKQGAVTGGWITATVAVGHNPADNSGTNFSSFANAGHTVICRINNGYSDVGTIPLPQYYADFAQRCANFVQNSSGCEIWLIGNETNLAVEWPPDGTHKAYVSPQDYADCFRLVYNAIKAVRPTHKVICQALAPWGGPYGPGTMGPYTHDGCPLSWVDYMNEMLTAIKGTGGLDGIALHVGSRGYTYNDIHSTQQISVSGKNLYWSFYVYKDWVDYGIPTDLYHLPLYITESNGLYYWKGGHPENPSAHYEPGWMQEVFAEINRYNQQATTNGKPIFRCINMYRWCSYCDDWNMDGASDPYKAQILSDLDAAVAQAYQWPPSPPPAPGTITGYVRDRYTGTGIAGATVMTSPGGYSTTTASNGSYTLSAVPVDTYAVTASKLAYCYRTITGVTVTPGGTTTKDFSLTPIGSNMLVNGTFESGFQTSGVASGWTSWTSSWSNPITFADSTSVKRTGYHAQKWGRSDGLRVHGGICQSVGGVTPGRQYTITGWIRFQTTDPGAWAEIGYDLTGQTTNGEAASVQYTKLESGGQNTWLQYSQTVTATGSGIAVFCKFGQYNQGGAGPSWAYADDVSITEVQTPPVMVSVADDGVYQTGATSLHGNWLASDPESGIAGYYYAISTTPSEAGIISGGGWTSVGTATQATRTGLSLQNGQVYYVLAKARNPHNQYSDVMASDGIRVVESVPNLVEAKKRPDGRWIALDDVICAKAPSADCMGIRQPDHVIGMKVTKGTGALPGVTAGRHLAIMGRLASSDDTREITDAYVVAGGAGSVEPVFMTAGALGGADFFYNATPPITGQKGTPWGTGPNNVGLTVTVFGKVTRHGTGMFYMSDGSCSPLEIPVTCASGIGLPDVDDFVKVTGLVESGGLLVIAQSDIAQ